MTELDRLISESLHRRAGSVAAVPKSYADVTRRIVRRRRRVTSMTTAAVTLPTLVAVGWAATRPEPLSTITGDVPGGPMVEPTTTIVSIAVQGPYRCLGEGIRDGAYTYFDHCEPLGVATTVPATAAPTYVTDTQLAYPSIPPTTTMLSPDVLDRVLFVDASGGLDFRSDLMYGWLGEPPRFELPATRVVDETVVMPIGADSSDASRMIALLGMGGFDSWTPDLVAGTVPDGITTVVVIGSDWFSRHGIADTTTTCVPQTTLPSPVTTPAPC
jgi:hypothetical protein